jgi:glycosyltransferase involved in cell wall biosynthesis
MRIGIDYTAAARQRAGIGRYARELITALLALEDAHQYVMFAAVGQLPRAGWQREMDHVRAICNSPLAIRSVPLSDDWVARLWHRLRLPVPVETITGALDIFYSPDFVLPPTRRATRTLLTVHDFSFLVYPEHFQPRLVRYLNKVVPRSVDRADLVLADSEATRTDLITHLETPPDKVDVLYGGVDPRFRPEPEPGENERLRARYGIGDRPYVLSVGTLQPRKNYVRLIRAFARIADTEACGRAGLQLLIAGGRGWLYQDIFAEQEKHSDRVRILGFVDDADLPALYRNAALCAFPSLYEGFGFPVLEGMACGVPVITSSVSSLPEVAGDAALLVNPLDADDLAQAMARTLEDADLRRRMVTRGLAQAARFCWKRAASQLLDTFDALTSA